MQLWGFSTLESFDMEGGMKKTFKTKNNLDQTFLNCVSWNPNTVCPLGVEVGGGYGQISMQKMWHLLGKPQNILKTQRMPVVKNCVS